MSVRGPIYTCSSTPIPLRSNKHFPFFVILSNCSIFNWNWWLPAYCALSLWQSTQWTLSLSLSFFYYFNFSLCPEAENHIKWASVLNLFILPLVNSCMFFSLYVYIENGNTVIDWPRWFNWIRSMWQLYCAVKSPYSRYWIAPMW